MATGNPSGITARSRFEDTRRLAVAVIGRVCTSTGMHQLELRKVNKVSTVNSWESETLTDNIGMEMNLEDVLSQHQSHALGTAAECRVPASSLHSPACLPELR